MKLTIVSWNVNGIRAVGKKGFADFLKSKKPDILGIQEVKIGDSLREKQTFDFGGYTEFWNCAKRPGYAGTALLVKDSTAKEVISHECGIGEKQFDDEGRVHILEFPKFYLLNIYFPNARDDLSRIPFKQEFDALVLTKAKELKKKKPVIIMGDFNVAHEEIDIARPKANEGKKGFTQEERQDFAMFVKNGFVDTFRELNPKKVQYSWWTHWANARARNVGWRIDYVVVSKQLIKQIKHAFIWDEVMGSDHCPVGIEIEI